MTCLARLRQIRRPGLGALAGLSLCMAARAAGTLTVCIEAPPETFDMAQVQQSLTMNTVGLTIYESILDTVPGTVDLRPGLATAVDISPDGLQYTLHLRPEAVAAARRTVDRNERIALYRKAQRIVYDEMPLIPLADPQYFMAVNRKVKGFVTGPGADMDFRGVRVDER